MEPHLEIPWGGIVQFALAAAFGSWAWVVRTMGAQHIKTIDSLVTEVKELRREFTHEIRSLRVELAEATTRIGILEHTGPTVHK